MRKPAQLSNPEDTRSLQERLAALDQLSLPALRDLWQTLHGSSPPAMSKELLRLAIGYKIQEEASGGLSRRALLQLRTLSRNRGTQQGLGGGTATPLPKSGTKLLREWQGQVHEVLALEDGSFAYQGKTYRSLTVIAREITGVHWSGPRFFGLKTSRPRAEEVAHG